MVEVVTAGDNADARRAQFGNQIVHRFLLGDIQRGHGLIKDQQPPAWIDVGINLHADRRQPDALPFTTGEPGQ